MALPQCQFWSCTWFYDPFLYRSMREWKVCFSFSIRNCLILKASWEDKPRKGANHSQCEDRAKERCLIIEISTVYNLKHNAQDILLKWTCEFFSHSHFLGLCILLWQYTMFYGGSRMWGYHQSLQRHFAPLGHRLVPIRVNSQNT